MDRVNHTTYTAGGHVIPAQRTNRQNNVATSPAVTVVSVNSNVRGNQPNYFVPNPHAQAAHVTHVLNVSQPNSHIPLSQQNGNTLNSTITVARWTGKDGKPRVKVTSQPVLQVPTRAQVQRAVQQDLQPQPGYRR